MATEIRKQQRSHTHATTVSENAASQRGIPSDTDDAEVGQIVSKLTFEAPL
jgi:hypothetical protein